jgi:ubiquinone/menaquinone biosynthesis C-methylase UbiE
MTAALTADVGFDYSARIFGDQVLIDISRHSWSALRMQRCLRSLNEIRGAVLEVGCGAGRCIRTVAHHRPDLACHGCDISQKAIEVARAHNDGICYDLADAHRLPYADAQFDAVMVLDLIEHVPDVGGVLRELHRVCKPGAILHLHVPCEGHWLSVYRPLLACGIDVTREAVGHLHHFKRRQVRQYLTACGFELLRSANSMYLFGQAHDLLGWWTMLQRHDQGEIRLGTNKSAGSAQAHRGPFHIKHVLTRPAWWIISRVLPALQYLETRALAWQPMGAIGLCVTARAKAQRCSGSPAAR